MYIKFFDWDKTRDTHGVYPDFNNVLNKFEELSKKSSLSGF